MANAPPPNIAVVHTVIDALIACGVDNVTLFQNETAAQRLTDDVFDDQFSTCQDLTFKELDDHFKTYSELTVQQGHQIRIRPGTRKNLRPLFSGHVTNYDLDQIPKLLLFQSIK
jgi:hypothetical protein